MTTTLAKSRDYLIQQRRGIIARSLLGSIAGALPIPFLDDLAREIVLGSGYRAIGRAHHVDVSDEAIKTLVHGQASPPKIADLAVGGIIMKIASGAAKRMLVAIATVNRAKSAARTYVTMTLFDHYCARLHTGLALDAGTAAALREEIGKAIDNTPGALALHPFRRGLLAAGRATLRAPLELADLATGGRVRKLLKSGDSDVAEPTAVDAVEQAMDAALATKKGFLSRTVTAVEVQLSSEANPYIDGAIESLDRRWRARMAAGVTSK
jgi:hypothetical protein